MAPAQLARLEHTAGVGDDAHLPMQVLHVVGHPLRLVLHIESRLQARIVGRDARGAGIAVALQGLDAAQGEQETAGRIDKIGADAQRPGHVHRCDQLARGDDPDALPQAMHHQRVHQRRQRLADGQSHRIHQGHGRSPTAALGAIKSDEIRRPMQAPAQDRLAETVQPDRIPQHQLDAGRLAGHAPDPFDHVENVVVALDLGMTVGADGIGAGPDAADAGDFLGHLHGREDAALAGLGPLAEFDLEHPHLGMGRNRREFRLVEPAGLVTYAVLGGTDLEHQIRAAFEVPGRQSALTGIQPALAQPGPAGQGLNRRTRQGAVTHARHVDDGRRGIGLLTVLANGHRMGRNGIGVEGGKRAVHEHDAAGCVNVLGGTEGPGVGGIPGRAIDPFPLGAIERQLFPIHGKEVLAKELAQMGEQVTETANHRIVVADRIACLTHVDHVQHQDHQHQQTDGEDEEGGHHLEAGEKETGQFRGGHEDSLS